MKLPNENPWVSGVAQGSPSLGVTVQRTMCHSREKPGGGRRGSHRPAPAPAADALETTRCRVPFPLVSASAALRSPEVAPPDTERRENTKRDEGDTGGEEEGKGTSVTKPPHQLRHTRCGGAACPDLPAQAAGNGNKAALRKDFLLSSSKKLRFLTEKFYFFFNSKSIFFCPSWFFFSQKIQFHIEITLWQNL